MTGRTDLERTLDRFLGEGPETVSDHAVSRALDAIDQTKQRRDLFAPWRFTLMINFSRLAAAALVAVVAVGGALYLVGRTGAVGSQGPTPTPSSAPTAAIARYTCGIRTLRWDGSSAIDLTGTWAGDDAGVYYLRQIGNQVWWLGMSGLGGTFERRGTEWTNVFLGTRSGDTLTGTYADVPQGQIQDNGPVPFKLTPTSDGGITLVRTTPLTTTGFGGLLLTPCTLG